MKLGTAHGEDLLPPELFKYLPAQTAAIFFSVVLKASLTLCEPVWPGKAACELLEASLAATSAPSFSPPSAARPAEHPQRGPTQCGVLPKNETLARTSRDRPCCFYVVHRVFIDLSPASHSAQTSCCCRDPRPRTPARADQFALHCSTFSPLPTLAASWAAPPSLG